MVNIRNGSLSANIVEPIAFLCCSELLKVFHEDNRKKEATVSAKSTRITSNYESNRNFIEN